MMQMGMPGGPGGMPGQNGMQGLVRRTCNNQFTVLRETTLKMYKKIKSDLVVEHEIDSSAEHVNIRFVLRVSKYFFFK